MLSKTFWDTSLDAYHRTPPLTTPCTDCRLALQTAALHPCLWTTPAWAILDIGFIQRGLRAAVFRAHVCLSESTATPPGFFEWRLLYCRRFYVEQVSHERATNAVGRLYGPPASTAVCYWPSSLSHTHTRKYAQNKRNPAAGLKGLRASKYAVVVAAGKARTNAEEWAP